jgi:hypothetical protein
VFFFYLIDSSVGRAPVFTNSPCPSHVLFSFGLVVSLSALSIIRH